jgi:hypothetical protein
MQYVTLTMAHFMSWIGRRGFVCTHTLDETVVAVIDLCIVYALSHTHISETAVKNSTGIFIICYTSFQPYAVLNDV